MGSPVQKLIRRTVIHLPYRVSMGPLGNRVPDARRWPAPRLPT